MPTMPHTAPTTTTADWAVIFDWDGVIVDSSASHCASWERLAAEENLYLPPDHFLKGFGCTNEHIIPNLLKWTTDPAEVRRLSLRKEQTFRAIVADQGITVLPGARELIAALTQARIPFAIGSATQRENIDTILARIGLTGFQAIIAAENVSRGKPDPQVFLLAAAALGQPADRCVVIEDAHFGIEAARRAGMAVVGVATTNPLADLAYCDLAVHRLTGVTPDILRGLVPVAVRA